MPISYEDGDFALDCWKDSESDKLDAFTVYCDNSDELRAYAQEKLGAGRYRYFELLRWNETARDWDLLEVISDRDQA